MKNLFISFIILICLLSKVTARQINVGMLYGLGHAFCFSGTENLVLDNEAGVSEGLQMVFYLKDSSWKKSTTIAYSSNQPKSDDKNKPIDIAKSVVENFKNKGSADYHISFRTNIDIDDSTAAEIFHFTGDKWGNYEAVAYIEEDNCVNFLVYNSKNKKDFQKYYKDFIKIVKSYFNIYSMFRFISKADFKEKKEEADKSLESEYYKNYESKVTSLVGQSMANQLRICFAGTDNKPDSVEIFFRIQQNGYLSAIYLYDNKEFCECFSWPFMLYKFPEHNENLYFLFNLSIKYKEDEE